MKILASKVFPKHHECGARVDQMRRGLSYDAHRTRSACLRWYHARLPGQVAQSGNSALAVERTKPAELSRNIVEGFCMMHIEHAVLVCAGIMRVCPARWLNLVIQHRCAHQTG